MKDKIAVMKGKRFALFSEGEIIVNDMQMQITSSQVKVGNEIYDLFLSKDDDIDKVLDFKETFSIREYIYNPTFSNNKKPYSEEKYRLFVDMDGTLAEFKVVDTIEKLYEENYFLSLKPNESVVKAIKKIIMEQPNIEVFVLSAVLKDSQYAIKEKNQWLDRELPEIPTSNRIYSECGKSKANYIPEGLQETDYLLDDYTINLNDWDPPARGIKLLNGINNTHGTWKKDKVDFSLSAEELSAEIVTLIKLRKIRKESIIHDEYTNICLPENDKTTKER